MTSRAAATSLALQLKNAGHTACFAGGCVRDKLLGLIEGKEKKLANANFTERAPAEVVAKERESLAQWQNRLAAVRQALTDLQARL